MRVGIGGRETSDRTGRSGAVCVDTETEFCEDLGPEDQRGAVVNILRIKLTKMPVST